MIPSLRDLEQAGCLGRTDAALARTLTRLAGVTSEAEPVSLAVALASRMISAGHVCLDLGAPPSFELLRPFGREPGEDQDTWSWPDASAWADALSGTSIVDVAPERASDDALAERRPLVLDARGRLYLRRYWEHERALARALVERAGSTPEIDDAVLTSGLDRLFSARAGTDAQASTGAELQRCAVEAALRRRLCVVSGGPGTGKTSTVARILVLAVEQARALGRPDPRIVLIAPTGKAAAALTSALAKNLDGLACDDAVRAAVPREASTIHRALGSRGGVGAGFGRSAEHPLDADLVVVDEASMVDLALMRRLVDAVPKGARLVMMGDADQLASVEAGAVLSDICGSGADRDARPDAPLAAGVVRLEHSYRFAAGSGIAVLARAVNAGDAHAAFEVLADAGHADVAWIDRSEPGWPLEIVELVDAGFSELASARDPGAGLAGLTRFCVLSPHRVGPLGTLELNEWIARRERRPAGAGFEPILVERNDRVLGLYNGDLGLRGGAGEAGAPARVYFAQAAGETGAASLRSLSPLRLPPHSPAWAMSVHKSQGSEFETVLVVLPDRASPVLTREMLYTAITRAREKVVIWAPRDVLAQCIERRVQRSSGLRDALWGRGD